MYMMEPKRYNITLPDNRQVVIIGVTLGEASNVAAVLVREGGSLSITEVPSVTPQTGPEPAEDAILKVLKEDPQDWSTIRELRDRLGRSAAVVVRALCDLERQGKIDVQYDREEGRLYKLR